LEKEKELGGYLRQIHYLLDGSKTANELKSLVARVKENKNIELFTQAKIEKVEGFIGNFKTTISTNGTSKEIEHGAVIVATGAKEYKPTEYLYGKNERVITQLELEQKLAVNGGLVEGPARVQRTSS
jgi:heterodisulfide reductase subunit A